MRFKLYWTILKETINYWKKDRVSHIAAALAYYTIFSIGPLLIICIAIAGFIFGNDAAQGQILKQISDMIGEGSANQIKIMIVNGSNFNTGIIASMIGIILLLFGAGGLFGELQNGLNQIWGVEAKSNVGFWYMVKTRFLSMTMVFGFAFLLLVSLVISTLITFFSTYLNNLIPGATIFWLIINFFISLFLITILFAMLFKYLPDVKIRWHDVWLGVIANTKCNKDVIRVAK